MSNDKKNPTWIRVFVPVLVAFMLGWPTIVLFNTVEPMIFGLAPLFFWEWLWGFLTFLILLIMYLRGY